jgi:hypothetical protein
MKRGSDWIGFASSTFCVRNEQLIAPRFRLPLALKRLILLYMTTVTKPCGFRGWSIRCASFAMALAFCASALADPSKNVVTSTKPQTTVKKTHKVCYALITGSAIRQPCNRLSVIPTTGYQLDRIGAHSATND